MSIPNAIPRIFAAPDSDRAGVCDWQLARRPGCHGHDRIHDRDIFLYVRAASPHGKTALRDGSKCSGIARWYTLPEAATAFSSHSIYFQFTTLAIPCPATLFAEPQ